MNIKWAFQSDIGMLKEMYLQLQLAFQILKLYYKDSVEMTLSTVIHTYNSIGGIDQSDQMTTFYPTERKRIKKWSKKHFIHLTSISSFNASIIHKKKGNKLDTLNFCTTLVEQIVEKYRTIVKSSVKCRGGRPSLEGNPFYLADRHLILIPPPDKKDKPT